MANRNDVVSRVQASLRAALDRAGLTRSGRSLVVAVSGGADSSCLLDALVAMLPDAPHRLVVGHVDHSLRPDSSADAEHVRALAGGYGLPCEVMRVDAPALAAAERRGVEEAARLGRYRALRDIAATLGSAQVATGHTRDDSVESVLIHLLRGTGGQGLGGIGGDETLLRSNALGEPRGQSRPRLWLVRPLLGVGRADTTSYCQARGVHWLTDPTNDDPRMLRNRVRGHLLPVLRTYNPAVDEAVDRLSLVMRDEEILLQQIAEQRYRELVREAGGRLEVDLAGWSAPPVALQRRLVRRIAQDAGHDELGFDAVERSLAVGQQGGPRRAQLGSGLVVERRRDRLDFEIEVEGTL